MKKIFYVLTMTLLLLSCTSKDKSIDGDDVKYDEETMIYTYKNDTTKVTGIVIFWELDPKTAKKYKKFIREVNNGKRINIGYNYFPNGSISAEIPYDENGLITGTIKLYYENGDLFSTSEFKDNNEHGLTQEYSYRGIQTKEILYRVGKKIKEYDFDKDGNKIIPVVEKLKLLEYKTGFYEFSDKVNYQLLYQPMVIMKWKNVTNGPISDRIEIKGIFISNGEEWASASDYFQGYSDPPMQVGLARQSVLKSSVGYTNSFGINRANISCQIFINNQLFKTIKINNEILTTNRIY